jgi:hypothetical protein
MKPLNKHNCKQLKHPLHHLHNHRAEEVEAMGAMEHRRLTQ